jgi:DNA-binding NtrC family response regulator
LTKTILILDDEPIVRQSLVDYFKDHLWKPVATESGEEALKLLEKISFHGAVVDVRLRGMDGNTFIQQAYEMRPEMSFVICTGSPEYEIPHEVQKLPTVSHHVFIKPLMHIEHLEKELEQLIARIH